MTTKQQIDDAEQSGYVAFKYGASMNENPYIGAPNLMTAWDRSYLEAKNEQFKAASKVDLAIITLVLASALVAMINLFRF